MQNLRLIFRTFIIVLAGLMLWPSAAQALSVEALRFGVHPDKTRMVLEMDGAADYRVFVLSDPYRMVIDLPSFDWKAGTIRKPPQSGITEVRHGILQPGIARLVFDLQHPVSVRGAFFLPAQGGEPNRLVVDFKPTSASVFAMEKSKVHGILDTSQTPPSYIESAAGTPAPAAIVPTPAPKAKKPLIILDPGHGGVDPGAIGANDVFEKHVTLALAKELKKQLEGTGLYRVKMTRETDVFIRLRDRVAFARKEEGDLFVSIHADSMPKSHVHGASIYTLSEKASDKQTEMLAARENRVDLIAGFDLDVEDDQVANILVDLAMRDTMNQSKYFANKLVDTLSGGGVHVLPNAHRYAGFAVLKAPDIPSVLVEAGFMSNRQEADKLNSTAYRRKVARALVDGINNYFEQVRKNSKI